MDLIWCSEKIIKFGADLIWHSEKKIKFGDFCHFAPNFLRAKFSPNKVDNDDVRVTLKDILFRNSHQRFSMKKDVNFLRILRSF